MAIFRMSAQVISRAVGRSATAAAAYRAGALIVDERTGLKHDYRHKGSVLHSAVVLPDGAPAWSREELWNQVERIERRRDAQLAREFELALPRELDRQQQIKLVDRFIRAEFVARGMAVDWAFHNPIASDRLPQPHAHVMTTLRSVGPEGLTNNKDRSWNDKALLNHWRASWAEHVNAALQAAGRPERVDHRSLADRGIDREPEPKIGPVARAMERRGRRTDRGDEWRQARERNSRRAQTRAQRMKEWRMKVDQKQVDQQKPPPPQQSGDPRLQRVRSKASVQPIKRDRGPKLRPDKKEHWLTKLQREAAKATEELFSATADKLGRLLSSAPPPPVKAKPSARPTGRPARKSILNQPLNMADLAVQFSKRPPPAGPSDPNPNRTAPKPPMPDAARPVQRPLAPKRNMDMDDMPGPGGF
ncbi:MAG: MobQ family relaxase [Ferrovibrio sp.]